MDPTSARFGYCDPFSVAPTFPRDDQPGHPEDQWMYLEHGNYNLIPSAFPVPGHGFVDPVPPNPRLFHPYDLQNTGLPGASPFALEAQVAQVGFQDPAPIDWDVYDLDIYPLLLNLTLVDADVDGLTPAHFTDPSSYSIIPSQEAQDLHSALHSPFPPMLPTSGGEPTDMIPRHVDPIRPTETEPYLDIHEDGVCVCIWKKSGNVCGFKSSTDLVKRHLRRRHFKLKYVISHVLYSTPDIFYIRHFACPVCDHRFFTYDKCALHLNVQ